MGLQGYMAIGIYGGRGTWTPGHRIGHDTRLGTRAPGHLARPPEIGRATLAYPYESARTPTKANSDWGTHTY
eukprot:2272687-Pyramimonas_sp.AAC.1